MRLFTTWCPVHWGPCGDPAEGWRLMAEAVAWFVAGMGLLLCVLWALVRS